MPGTCAVPPNAMAPPCLAASSCIGPRIDESAPWRKRLNRFWRRRSRMAPPLPATYSCSKNQFTDVRGCFVNCRTPWRRPALPHPPAETLIHECTVVFVQLRRERNADCSRLPLLAASSCIPPGKANGGKSFHLNRSWRRKLLHAWIMLGIVTRLRGDFGGRESDLVFGEGGHGGGARAAVGQHPGR